MFSMYWWGSNVNQVLLFNKTWKKEAQFTQNSMQQLVTLCSVCSRREETVYIHDETVRIKHHFHVIVAHDNTAQLSLSRPLSPYPNKTECFRERASCLLASSHNWDYSGIIRLIQSPCFSFPPFPCQIVISTALWRRESGFVRHLSRRLLFFFYCGL